jgi:hypothetical protein
MYLTSFAKAVAFRSEHETWISSKKLYMSQADEIVMTEVLNGISSNLVIPHDLFGSTDVSPDRDRIMPAMSLSMSVETFDRSLAALAAEVKWPVNYLASERVRRECERLALYLMGVADTYMGSGPNTIPSTPATNLSISLLYFCAGILGIPEAYTEPVSKPRRQYGLQNNSIAATRIVEQSSKHAISNSVITFYELIILYLLQVEAYESAVTLLKKLQTSNRIRAFLAFTYLAMDEDKAYHKTVGDILNTLKPDHEMHVVLSHLQESLLHPDLSSEARLQAFDLRQICSHFPEPFLGNIQD